jgi:hypothetical protein
MSADQGNRRDFPLTIPFGKTGCSAVANLSMGAIHRPTAILPIPQQAKISRTVVTWRCLSGIGFSSIDL